jgi:predicted MFS family arabinose efflux permease
MGAARIGPAIVFGLAAGVVADRFDRRHLLQFTRGCTALIVGVMGGLTVSGNMSIVLLFILTAFAAAVQSHDGPARLSLSPLRVPPRHAFAAIGLNRAFMQAASLTGPLVGGLLVNPLTVGGVMVVNTVLYVFSGLGMGRLGPIPPTGAPQSPLESFRQGFGFVWHEPTTRAYIAASGVLILLGSSVNQLMPSIAFNMLGVGAVENSYLLSGVGVGALVGSLLITTMSRWPRPGWALLGMAFSLGILCVLLGQQRDLLPAILLVGLHGAVIQIYTGGVGNIIQMIAPNEVRGRVIGIWLLNFSVGSQLGTIILGTLGSLFGLPTALTLAGIAILCTAAVMARTRVIRDVSPDVMTRDEPRHLDPRPHH